MEEKFVNKDTSKTVSKITVVVRLVPTSTRGRLASAIATCVSRYLTETLSRSVKVIVLLIPTTAGRVRAYGKFNERSMQTNVNFHGVKMYLEGSWVLQDLQDLHTEGSREMR